LPNDAHRALAKFCQNEDRPKSGPSCTTFQLITQNVDGLSRKASAELNSEAPAEGDKFAFYEMHGCVS
jgi:NAD-dependent deacetylase sirtuin 5